MEILGLPTTEAELVIAEQLLLAWLEQDEAALRAAMRKTAHSKRPDRVALTALAVAVSVVPDALALGLRGIVRDDLRRLGASAQLLTTEGKA